MTKDATSPGAARVPAFRRAEPDARRRTLIEACARVLAREGATGASVRAIAKEAGVSPGLIGHYFAGVEGLVAETYRAVVSRVNGGIFAEVEAAGGDARARIDTFIRANFSPVVADPALLATWIAFWTMVASRPLFRGLHHDKNGEFRAGIEGLLADCGVAEDRLRAEATALSALIDGLWLELCLAPDGLSADQAVAIVRAQVERITG
ncbi:MAG: TetR family transcriptional regulator C-terminal domain-containing protein [Proteobacteria bacterium]|nr:TetR family transcriptional regulator C-terminal domain-containing protein [Pseudomonadota bacterium]